MSPSSAEVLIRTDGEAVLHHMGRHMSREDASISPYHQSFTQHAIVDYVRGAIVFLELVNYGAGGNGIGW